MKIAKLALIVLTVWGIVAAPTVQAAGESDGFSTAPTSKEGKRWRIAYYQGGADENYYYLGATVRGLVSLGWIDSITLPEDHNHDPEALWRFLARKVKSDHVEFLDDGFFSANRDEGTRGEVRTLTIERLQRGDDIDLIIAMGTWAGKDLANDKHSVPTVVMSTSDPISAGIIKDVDDSGLDHVHARVDPRRCERQVRLFHDIIGFERLGVAFERSIYGRSYAAVESIERVSTERGFEIVPCYTTSDIADFSVAGKSVQDCFHRMAKEADAVYVTRQGGVNVDTIPELVGIANQHRIPTFYQSGSDGVKWGFLLSMSRAEGFRPVGRFLAATVAKILNGAKPRQLKQLYEEAPNIAINLKTAEVIGLYLYAEVLAASDELYREIERPR